MTEYPAIFCPSPQDPALSKADHYAFATWHLRMFLAHCAISEGVTSEQMLQRIEGSDIDPRDALAHAVSVLRQANDISARTRSGGSA